MMVGDIINGYYVFGDLTRNGVLFSGVQNKINQQTNEFTKIAHVDKIAVKLKNCSSVVKRLPGGSHLFEWKEALNYIQDPSFVYIRKENCDYGFYDFIRQIKRKKSNCKILLELPTYPYDSELLRSFYNFPLFLKDYFYRNRFHLFIDRIVTYSDDEKIFGIPTIRIQNGIDVSKYQIVHPRNNDNEIHLLAVAALQPYHGYDRVIEGLHQYYQQGGSRIVKFFVVGSGEAENDLKALVEKYKLNDIVQFFGSLTGDPLTEIFNQSDIGLGSFGLYRRGGNISSGLKIREYLARGLPIASGCDEDILTNRDLDFYLQFPNDSSPIDIIKIIHFYDGLKSNNTCNIQDRIMAFARENIDITHTFKPVLDYLLMETD